MASEYEDHLRATRDTLARQSGRCLGRARRAEGTQEQIEAWGQHQHNRGAARAVHACLEQYATLRVRGWGDEAQGRLDGLAQVDQQLDDVNIAQAGDGAEAIVQRVRWLAMLWQETQGRVRRLQRWGRTARDLLHNGDSLDTSPSMTHHADALEPLLEPLRGRWADSTDADLRVGDDTEGDTP